MAGHSVSGTSSPQRRRWPGRIVDAGSSVLQDRPALVSLSLIAAVALHGLLTWPFSWLDPYGNLQTNLPGTTAIAVMIYLGTSSAAAIVAGLAGVILVFVVGSPSPRVRQLRHTAGKPLHRTWLTVVAEPFAAALLGILAAIMQTTSGREAAPWLFELGVVLLLHGSLRLLWLLSGIVTAVAAADHELTRDENMLSLDTLFRR